MAAAAAAAAGVDRGSIQKEWFLIVWAASTTESAQTYHIPETQLHHFCAVIQMSGP